MTDRSPICYLSVITHSDPRRGQTGPREFNYFWAKRQGHSISSFWRPLRDSFALTSSHWCPFTLVLYGLHSGSICPKGLHGMLSPVVGVVGTQQFTYKVKVTGRGGSCVSKECREGVRPSICKFSLKLNARKTVCSRNHATSLCKDLF